MSNPPADLALSREQAEFYASALEMWSRDYVRDACHDALAAHDWKVRAEKAEAERDATVKALEPFAAYGKMLDDTWWDHGDNAVVYGNPPLALTIGNFRAALPTPNTENAR